jgi:catechol 2,3-dioxygenase-like lactoylglutathione lyase family enzyme
MNVKIAGHAPVLLVEDLGRALDYYRDKLGFDVEVWQPRHYGQASRDGRQIHFACFKESGPRPNAEAVPPDMFDVYLYVDDVHALYEELRERGADLLHGPVEQGYGLREIRVRDPHGYILAFGKLPE